MLGKMELSSSSVSSVTILRFRSMIFSSTSRVTGWKNPGFGSLERFIVAIKCHSHYLISHYYTNVLSLILKTVFCQLIVFSTHCLQLLPAAPLLETVVVGTDGERLQGRFLKLGLLKSGQNFLASRWVSFVILEKGFLFVLKYFLFVLTVFRLSKLRYKDIIDFNIFTIQTEQVLFYNTWTKAILENNSSNKKMKSWLKLKMGFDNNLHVFRHQKEDINKKSRSMWSRLMWSDLNGPIYLHNKIHWWMLSFRQCDQKCWVPMNYITISGVNRNSGSFNRITWHHHWMITISGLTQHIVSTHHWNSRLHAVHHVLLLLFDFLQQLRLLVIGNF